jgi:ferritin-like metal-binding protein YciE
MTNKNPFEIRLEVLKMAKEMMDNHYNESMNAWWSMVTKYTEEQNKTVDQVLKQTEELMKSKPSMYTPSELMEKAQELYGFVAKRD